MGAVIVFGYGPGISHATAERFGREGYSLALADRRRGRGRGRLMLQLRSCKFRRPGCAGIDSRAG